ncbi:MAG: carboxylating nicotinate-nucleotide diphosphorylase [Planctomycetota bacterium]
MIDYVTVTADTNLETDLRQLVRLAKNEDLRDQIDWTSACTIDSGLRGASQVVPRVHGVCAGVVTVPWIVDEFEADLSCESFCEDGEMLVPGKPILLLRGNVRDMLTCERTILNVLGRLCGVATETKRYVDAIEGLKASIYDTRKMTPGWRLLEKYAVACGGGRNHRRGLYDGFLIKDNHLQLGGSAGVPLAASQAATRAIEWREGQNGHGDAPPIVEIEVDSLQQLRDVLPVGPDIVLIDNFSLDQMHQAVQLRDELNPSVELEVSGNVTIDTITPIAATGVERVSSGALTHQATWLDLGLDWHQEEAT